MYLHSWKVSSICMEQWFICFSFSSKRRKLFCWVMLCSFPKICVIYGLVLHNCTSIWNVNITALCQLLKGSCCFLNAVNNGILKRQSIILPSCKDDCVPHMLVFPVFSVSVGDKPKALKELWSQQKLNTVITREPHRIQSFLCLPRDDVL